ncbi:MAG TPA: BglII/BstYI family type II restriction endonuclease [Paludibacter sp.]|nr:BglII/BstYI family type II restriction endonuclease [Paludibacter sp.]
MKTKTKYFHCSEQLQTTLAREINEVEFVMSKVQWNPSFRHSENGNTYEHQTAYNKALYAQFNDLKWEPQPLLRANPRLIGDFRKGLVFVEIQFGNSSTLYRDYYKFQYGLANGLLSLAVLIVPTKPSTFFPTRPKSVQNMAEYDLADNYFTVLPINVPVMLVGLLPEN